MVNKLTNNLDNDLDIHYINNKIEELEIELSQYNIFNYPNYQEWLKDFKKIYGIRETNLRLYIQYALLYFIGLIFVSKLIFNEADLSVENGLSLKKLKLIEEKIRNTFRSQNIIEFEYFNPLVLILDKNDLSIFVKIITKISVFLFSLTMNPIYLFDYLFQRIISPIFRHKSGEYYTPSFLVEKMVEESYVLGDSVLDPCCGSGNFLVGIILKILSFNVKEEEKISAINKIWGFDINPISLYLSKINVLFLSKDFNSDIKINLYVCDFLFDSKDKLKNKFDLIIGNPPWYTYRDAESKEHQNVLKSLAEKLEIKPRPKNILNLEVSTLFFYKANYFMKNKGKIFFVITKGVITGSHASRFRYFKGFSDIKIWLFNKQVEKIFNIDFICLYAHKSLNGETLIPYEVPSYYFYLDNYNINEKNYDKTSLKLKKEEIFIPFSIEQKGEKVYVKKLIPKEKKDDLLPLGKSIYKDLFHKGADLNPRNLIFVNEYNINDTLAKINPDERIFKKSKTPWNKKEFKDEVIEKKYIFRVVKSTELVKFYIYDTYKVFLPLSKDDLSFIYVNLDKNAKIFYDKINNIYLNYKKETTTHKSLIENLDRWSKLINSRQLSKIKVVYNNSGSIVNSAVIQGDFLITGDLSFYDTINLDEAFYLSAILNSNILTEQIRIMKSSRHIFKLPFNIPIKKYDPKNSIHQKFAKLGREGNEIANSFARNVCLKSKEIPSKIKIQKILKNELKPILSQIDELLIKELKPPSN
ncbi:MAG: class I SAM-dependent DNA methyltransferase [Promethearchaeota archaeon]